MKKKGTVAKIALGVTAVAAVAGNLACNYAIKRPDPLAEKEPETREVYKKRAEVRQRNNRNFFNCEPEDLSLTSVNSDNMRAWFLPAKKATKRFVICVHGYKCNGPDEFSHFAPFYHNDLGYNYLLPDLTGHGRSEGDYIGFGAPDAKNILLWVDYLINRFGEDIEIILHGISMGAATVMNCNEMSPPDQVKLIIEDCGFTSAVEIMNNTLKDRAGFRCEPLVHLGSVFAKLKAGYFFEESNPLKNMYKAKNPILFIHGMEDTFVPFEHGKKLYDACKVEKDCLWVPETAHAFSYYNAKEEYESKIKEFIAKHMDKKDTVKA